MEEDLSPPSQPIQSSQKTNSLNNEESPKSKLHEPTIATLNQQRKHGSDGHEHSTIIPSTGENSGWNSTMTVEKSREEIPVFKNNLENVESKLFSPTANILNSVYKPKSKEDDDRSGSPVPTVHAISSESHLLKVTTALTSGAWVPKEDENTTTEHVNIKPIHQDSHLLTTTASIRNIKTPEQGSPKSTGSPISAISPESGLLRVTTAVKAAAWNPDEAEQGADHIPPPPPSTAPINPDSPLLRQTAAMKSAAWVPGDEQSLRRSPPSIRKLDSNSPLLRTTKNYIAGTKEKVVLGVVESSGSDIVSNKVNTRNTSPVSSSLLRPTAAARNNQSAAPHPTAINSETSETTKWNSNSKILTSPLDAEIPRVTNDLDDVHSKLHITTAGMKNAVYKPKPKEEDTADIHGTAFNVSRKVTVPEPPSLPAKSSSPYSDVKSKLLVPTEALKNSTWSPKLVDSGIKVPKSISPDSSLLKSTTSVSSSTWSPKSGEKKIKVQAKLPEDSPLLKPTQAAEDAKWKGKEEDHHHDSSSKSVHHESITPSSHLLKPTIASESSAWDKEKERDVTGQSLSTSMEGHGVSDTYLKPNEDSVVTTTSVPSQATNEVTTDSVSEVIPEITSEATYEVTLAPVNSVDPVDH